MSRIVQPAATQQANTHRIAWIDALRVLGALLIFLYHFGGDYESAALPSAAGTGALGWFSLIRPHFAEWGISLFVVLAGTSLVLSHRNTTTYLQHLRRRAIRLLLPLWIVGVPYVLAGLALGEMSYQEFWKIPIWFAGLSVVSPETYLPVSQAWWYVTLALQCAAIAPALRRLVDRAGVPVAVIVLALIELLTLACIGTLPTDWQYLAQGLVLARLVELAAGLIAGCVLVHTISPSQIALALLTAVGAAVLAEMVGAITSASAIAVWGLAVVSFSLILANQYTSTKMLSLIAVGTYPFYLVHAPIGKYSIRALASLGVGSPLTALATALGLSVCAAGIVAIAELRLRTAAQDRRSQ